MYNLHITLINGNTHTLTFCDLDIAVECGKDHQRVPDVKKVWVTSQRGYLVWEGM